MTKYFEIDKFFLKIQKNCRGRHFIVEFLSGFKLSENAQIKAF